MIRVRAAIGQKAVGSQNHRLIGAAMNASSDATEEIRVTPNTSSQTAPATRPLGQCSGNSKPKAVATPLPPRNWKNTGNRWPRKAQKPTSAAAVADSPRP